MSKTDTLNLPVNSFVKNFKNKRLLLFLIFIFFLLLFLVGIRLFLKPELIIITTPEGSFIEVDDKYTSISKFSMRLSRKSHKIRVSKGGYKIHEETVVLKKNTTLNIHLEEEELSSAPYETLTTIPRYLTSDASVQNEVIVAIDRNTSKLIKISKEKVFSLYPNEVYTYSFSYPYVSFVEGIIERDKIGIINLENNKVSRINASDIKPISSLAVPSDFKHLYILGGFSLKTLQSTLYVSSFEEFNPIEILNIRADKVECLGDNLLILTQTADAADKTVFNVFDTAKKKVVYSTSGNSYLISPDNAQVSFLSSNNLTTVDSQTLAKNTVFLKGVSSIVWENSKSLILIKNKDNGIEISRLNPGLDTENNVSFVRFIEGTSSRSTLGVIKNILYLINFEGKIIKIKI